MKRIFILMLACFMLLSVLPFSVLAEEAHEHETACPGENAVHTDAQIACSQVIATVDPVCSNKGYTLYRCECGKVFPANYVDADPNEDHDWEVVTEAKEPTCSEPGYTAELYCDTCKTTVSPRDLDPTGEHNYVANEKGEEVCECGAFKPESPCAKDEDGEHAWANPVITAPSCTTLGSIVYSCENCEETKTVAIAKADHEYSEEMVEALEPTCTEAGHYAYYTCANCDTLFNDEYEAFDPTVGEDLAATGHFYFCSATGATVECEVCEEMVSAEGATKIHGDMDVIGEQKATCETWGFVLEACVICGEAEQTPTAPLGHTKAEDAEAIATGVQAYGPCGGTQDVYECERFDACGEYVYVQVEEPSEHELAFGLIHEADCVTKKTEGYYCTVEGCTYVDEESLVYGEKDAENHADVQAAVRPDCTKGGTAIVVCEACGTFIGSEVIKAGEHELAYTVDGADATCKDAGVLGTEYCVNCDYVNDKLVAVPEIAHTKPATGVVNTAANCTNGATVTYTCTVCEEEQTETVSEKLENVAIQFNSYNDAIKVHADLEITGVVDGFSCADYNFITYSCSCNATIVVLNPNKTHTFEEGEYSCNTANECVVCGTLVEAEIEDVFTEGEGEDEVIYENGKLHEIENLVEVGRDLPTCTVGGKIYYACENCDFTTEEDIDALGHEVVIIPGKNATCQLPGLEEGAMCTRCFLAEVQEIIPALGHDYTETILNQTVGCDQDGYTVKGCERCSALIVENFVPAIGHENAEGEEIIRACDDEVEDRYCVNCEEIIPTHIVEIHTENSTCTTQGYIVGICEDCGEIVVPVEFIPGFGEHSYEPDTTPATYKDGKIEWVCEHCGYIDAERTVIIPANENVLGLTLAHDNKNFAGAGYSDSSIIALTVNLNSVVDLGVWGVYFNVYYLASCFTYVGFEPVAGSILDGNCNAVDHVFDVEYEDEEEFRLGYVSVALDTSNDVDGNVVNAIVNGEDLGVITLYFEVNYSEAARIPAFVIEDVMAIDADAEEIETWVDEEGVRIETVKFLDLNGDDLINQKDVLAAMKIVSGEAATETHYNVAADVDKDGDVDVEDIAAIYNLILGAVDYDTLVGRAVEETPEVVA